VTFTAAQVPSFPPCETDNLSSTYIKTLLIEDLSVLSDTLNAFVADTAGDAVMSTDDNHKLTAKMGGADAKACMPAMRACMRAGCACAGLRSRR
jgi:hypothetical protein